MTRETLIVKARFERERNLEKQHLKFEEVNILKITQVDEEEEEEEATMQ